MDVMDYLNERAEKVDRAIDRILPEEAGGDDLIEASRHLIEAGGKRIRPVLTLTAAGAVDGRDEDALGAAVAVELLHTFTLVHDDFMDEDDVRRGTETVHEIWGDAMAINAGDALFAKVFEALNENVKTKHLGSREVTDLFGTLTDASFKVCQGQSLDVKFEDRNEVTKSEYMDMVDKKTGALIEASTRLGAILGGGSDEEVESLTKYGKLMGTAFQIRDDVLGATGEQEKVGKPVGSDIRKGKWTLLTVHAYQEASPEDREVLESILGKVDATKSEVEKVVEIFEKTDALGFARRKSREIVEEAKAELRVLPNSEAKEFLAKLADFTVEREH